MDNKEYKIKIFNESKNVIFSVSQINSISNKCFQNNYSLENLIQINNYFKMFDTIFDAIENISLLFKSNNYKLNIINNIIKISLIPGFPIKGKIEFELKEKPKDKNEQINDLLLTTNSLIKRITYLENENSKLKDDICYLKNKINQLNLINENTQIPINKKNFFSDSKILKTNETRGKMLDFIEDKNIKNITLIYSGTIDEDIAISFHKKCDGHSPTITLIKDTTNQIFGGYTEASWDSLERHSKYDSNTFIFSITKNIKIKSKKSENSIECNPKFGPVFGFGGDLTIVDKFLYNSSNMWTMCKTFNDFNFSITNGQQTFNIQELEVYLIIY